MRTVFLNSAGKLRSGWWIAIFFALLAILLFPLLLLSQGDVPIFLQALLVLTVSLACQLMRNAPASDLLGAINERWGSQLLVGVSVGALLMLVPAAFLWGIGSVNWVLEPNGINALAQGALLFAAVAATEELLFRGFIFQRLIDGIGEWPAQLAIAALFVLTHASALEGSGDLRYLAGANIFLASVLFGLAYLRTRSLALPLGVHFAANVVQGSVLGFGVSGDDTGGLLRPIFNQAPDWLTGGAFGIEASLPGFCCVALCSLVLLALPSAYAK